MRAGCGGHERLGVLGAWQGLLELLVLALARGNLVNLPQRELGFLELLGPRARKLANALELVCGRACRGKRGLVGIERLVGRGAQPRIEYLHVRGNREEPLVLVLPAEVDRPAYARRKLAHRTHMAVYLDTATAVCRDPPAYHAPIGVSPTLEETALDLEGVCPLTHRAGIGTLSHQKLNGREERRLASTRLAGEHRKAGGGLDSCVSDKRDIARMQLVEHQRPALP